MLGDFLQSQRWPLFCSTARLTCRYSLIASYLSCSIEAGLTICTVDEEASADMLMRKGGEEVVKSG